MTYVTYVGPYEIDFMFELSSSSKLYFLNGKLHLPPPKHLSILPLVDDVAMWKYGVRSSGRL